ncbi:hypothetical protein [Acinetobacter sp. 243_ASPC]|uniref:hypothetical protein n=1 Tax=Acinetobacter sp. 243_ASPC TaxID=1579345 RepID=UPI0006605BB3|nr:hypothetical protein [Acinetobacter sp. 243_ASPC]
MNLDELIEIGKKDLDISGRADQVKSSYEKALSSYSLALTEARNKLIDIFFDEVEAIFSEGEKFEIENNRDVAPNKNIIIQIKGTEIEITFTVHAGNLEEKNIKIEMRLIRGKSQDRMRIEMMFESVGNYRPHELLKNLKHTELDAMKLKQLEKENQDILKERDKLKSLNKYSYRILSRETGNPMGGLINQSNNFNDIFERCLSLMTILN